MSSWHDNITGYHNEETDDWHIDESDLKDLAMNRSPLIRLFKRLSQLQYIDIVVNISVVGSRANLTSACRDEDRRNPTVAAIVSQMLIVDKTVENSQLRLDKHSQHLNIIIPFGHSCMTDFTQVSEGEHL